MKFRRTPLAALTLSAAALVGIAVHEGYRDRAYYATPHERSAGISTIGFGTTAEMAKGLCMLHALEIIARMGLALFPFDPQRQAILLVGGDKGGADQRRFYKRLIQVADERYDEHVGSLAQQSKENPHGKKTR